MMVVCGRFDDRIWGGINEVMMVILMEKVVEYLRMWGGEMEAEWG